MKPGRKIVVLEPNIVSNINIHHRQAKYSVMNVRKLVPTASESGQLTWDCCSA
jgi:hypothetical protein